MGNAATHTGRWRCGDAAFFRRAFHPRRLIAVRRSARDRSAPALKRRRKTRPPARTAPGLHAGLPAPYSYAVPPAPVVRRASAPEIHLRSGGRAHRPPAARRALPLQWKRAAGLRQHARNGHWPFSGRSHQTCKARKVRLFGRMQRPSPPARPFLRVGSARPSVRRWLPQWRAYGIPLRPENVESGRAGHRAIESGCRSFHRCSRCWYLVLCSSQRSGAAEGPSRSRRGTGQKGQRPLIPF